MPTERISVFDMFKIGVGPSSSHTLAPWRAAQQFVQELHDNQQFDYVQHIQVMLYGSLAKTGKGHGTDIAVMLGLLGEDPITMDTNNIQPIIHRLETEQSLLLDGKKTVAFTPTKDVVFYFDATLPFHPNGLTFVAALTQGEDIASTFYSIGGGFVVKEGENAASKAKFNSLFPLIMPTNYLNIVWTMQ
jgi:L-serine dehydratase